MERGREARRRDHGGILVVKQSREDEFGQHGMSPRTQPSISNAVAWAERIVRHVDGVFLGK
jgi:hypothetical protein